MHDLSSTSETEARKQKLAKDQIDRMIFLAFLSGKVGRKVTNVEVQNLLHISYPALISKCNKTTEFKPSEIERLCKTYHLTVSEMIEWFFPGLVGEIKF